MSATEIYLDSNATTPVMQAALDAAREAMASCYGNPSSTHASGLRARALLDSVRARARRVIGAPDGKLMFTSGATEGIQAAVLSALCEARERERAGDPSGRRLLVYGATEHKAVPQALAHWNKVLGTGYELCELPVDGEGRHRLDVLRDLAPRAVIVCTMAANNESGAISDLAGIGKALRDAGSGARWLVDCVQALGKLDLDLSATGIDYAPFSGHKLYAPKGTGMLYVREGTPFTALGMGGGQEGGDRAGTENMSGIAALGAVLGALEQGGVFRTDAQLHAMRERLLASLRDAFPGIEFNTPLGNSLGTTINFSVPGLASKELLDLFDAAGVRLSSGSACSAAAAAPSYVLQAMGVPGWRASSAIRLSFGPLADDRFIDEACARIRHCANALRASGVCGGAMPLPPLTHLSGGGASGWIIADRASGECVLVDPAEPLLARTIALVRASGSLVRAIVSTRGEQGAALRRRLLDELDCIAEPTGADGWPLGQRTIVLGDDTHVECLALGARLIARLPAPGGASYLYGVGDGDRLPSERVLYAFSAASPIPCHSDTHAAPAQLRAAVERLGRIANHATLLCCAAAADGVPATTPAAEARGQGALAELLAAEPALRGHEACAPADLMQLDPSALPRFLAGHPDAQLIDVREHYEFIAGPPPAWGGRPAANIPYSQLLSQIPHWLRTEHTPLVFFCRSGARSARAVRWLQRLGYRNAWQLNGGIALGS